MSDEPKTVIDFIPGLKESVRDELQRLADQLSAYFNEKIDKLEEHIEDLEQELETARNRIRELEEALAAATSGT
jgi:predicted  nucleic acid-binding Zn-ribbon protein